MTTNFRGLDSELGERIVGIQFGLMSPEEIRRQSVVQVTTAKPGIGGLSDPRMGVLEAQLLCPTDGHNNIHCPGFFGHIELARPVFWSQYFDTIVNVLKCVCFSCSELLLDKEKYKEVWDLPNASRWEMVYRRCCPSSSKRCRRCGDDNSKGCRAIQPSTFRKEDVLRIVGVWHKMIGENGKPFEMVITAEMTLNIFSKISDENASFMGFHPVYSRPEWMICQVLPVPPVYMRPSVKHGAKQRSEDDLTVILMNILKMNVNLSNALKSNTKPDIIDKYTNHLTYDVMSLIDNKVSSRNPGSIGQRATGRDFQSVKSRLNTKRGRFRGNLMSKRVDYSARTVITGDPSISIRDVGIPIPTAKILTKPVIVNARNIEFLTRLVKNGSNWPGANELQLKGGTIVKKLEHMDTEKIRLNYGDVVHRHMLDGDMVLFNRQPSLHRNSMMGHRARILRAGLTFGLNLADTKSYNADFDGDEMNCHMPQDPESEAELKCLAAVENQIINPGNNSTIISIFQDALLAAHLISNKSVSFETCEAMQLLFRHQSTDPSLFQSGSVVSNYALLSQVMPRVTVNYGDRARILNGHFIRGTLSKDVLGRGIIQNACNTESNRRAAAFIDDIQNVLTGYMSTRAFSVGISDLVLSERAQLDIAAVMEEKERDAAAVIALHQLGSFHNTTNQTNEERLEASLSNIVNETQNECGKLAFGDLGSDTRFITMASAGSKGSRINIDQMTACVGQQHIDGKRVPYGYKDRTLPHFTKFDDSLSARGFVKHSYVQGLTPQEFFFHAMSGRVGLIDTAVKTSETGYIQRRLVKHLEDLMVNYDMTVRSNKGKIIQWVYGEDTMDPVKVQRQPIPFLAWSSAEVYNHFVVPHEFAKDFLKVFTPEAKRRQKKQQVMADQISSEMIQFLLNSRDKIVKNIYTTNGVFSDIHETSIQAPVPLNTLVQGMAAKLGLHESFLCDVTVLEIYQMTKDAFDLLMKLPFGAPTHLFKTLFFFNLAPKNLLFKYRFDKRGIQLLLESIVLQYKKAIIHPGEMVGIIAAQSIGEPSTQMTLNTFHYAGVASKSNVSRGVPRAQEILILSANIKNPSMTIFLPGVGGHEKTKNVASALEFATLDKLVLFSELIFEPFHAPPKKDDECIQRFQAFEDLLQTAATEGKSEVSIPDPQLMSKWIIRLELNVEAMFDKNITMFDVNYALQQTHGDLIDVVYSDYNDDTLVFRIRLRTMTTAKRAQSGSGSASSSLKTTDVTDDIQKLTAFHATLLNTTVLRGVPGITSTSVRKVIHYANEQGKYTQQEDTWVIDTVGTNLVDVLALDYVDATRTFTNSIIEIYDVLGVEAARQSIYNELVEVLEFDGGYVNAHHLTLLSDRMTHGMKLVSAFRHGINNDDTGPIAKASFEETPAMFLRAATHGELDNMRGISANIMCGQEGCFGTGAFNLFVDDTAPPAYPSNHKEEEEDQDGGKNSTRVPIEMDCLQQMCSTIHHLQFKPTGSLQDIQNPFN